jgi:transketolase
VVFIFSHDSIGVGEDGPTHQPVEQIMGLRDVPGLTVIRPADNAEVAETWNFAMQNNNGPTAIVLTRQKVPQIDRKACASTACVEKGAYVLWESHDHADVIIIGTGSELHLALKAGQKLANEGTGVRVVSMPSWEIFDQQPKKYRDQILSPKIRSRVVIEAGLSQGWEKYVGLDGAVVGMTSFGASAPGPVLYEKFEITTANLIARVKELISKK